MTSKKSILQIALGAALGAALTAVVMIQLQEPVKETPPKISVSTTAEEKTDTETQEETSQPVLFTRDISGNCTLLGTVLTQAGMPAANADVGVWLNDQPWSEPQPPAWTQADKDGKFRIDNIDGELPILLWAASEKLAVRTVENPECGVLETLVLPPGGEAVFTVKDNDKRPAANATVHLFGAGLWPPRTGKTDRDGRLRVTGMEIGEYAVLAEKGDLVFASKSPFEVSSDKTTEIDIHLASTTKLTLRVLNAENDAPVKDAFVIVRPSETSLIKTVMRTDNTGAAETLCPGDTCVASFAANGFLVAETVRLPRTDTAVFRLMPGGTAEGQVVDQNKTPISGAEIHVLGEMGNTLISIKGAEADQFHQTLLESAAAAPASFISLKKGSKKIIGPPTLFLPSTTDATNAKNASDERGRFALTGLPLRRIALTAKHPRMIPTGPPVPVALDTGKKVSDILLVMKPGAEISVRVLDERDVPVPDATIAVFDNEGRLIRNAQSNPDGYAEFFGLPFNARVEISARNYIARVLHTDKRTKNNEVEVSLEPAERTIYGRVKDSRGFGVGNASVTARLTRKGRLQVLTAVTEADGTFSLKGAGNGQYRIVADAGEQGRAQAADMTYRDDVKLVLDTAKARPTSDEQAPIIIAPPGWGADPIADNNMSADNLGVTAPGVDRTPTVAAPRRSDIAPPMSPTVSLNNVDTLPVTGPPPGKGALPIKIGGSAGKAIVTRVAAGSRVEVAGLSRGARILAVNGKKVKGPADAERAIKGPIGSVVMLEVSDSPDGSAPYTIIVQRERTP